MKSLPNQLVAQALDDPIFLPDQFNQSLAQLPPRVKDEVSHRGIALRAIAPFLRDHL